MKSKALLFLMVILGITSFIQTSPVFPSLTAENLEDKKVSIPKDTKGKFSLIGLAYSQKAQDDLQTWLGPVYSTFIAKPEKGGLFNDSYDIHVYFIPMFTGANQVAAGQAKKKMQNGLDKELKPYILIYKGDIDTYKKELSMSDKEKPYVFLLDKDGKIVYSTSGAYADSKMEKIEELIGEEEDDE